MQREHRHSMNKDMGKPRAITARAAIALILPALAIALTISAPSAGAAQTQAAHKPAASRTGTTAASTFAPLSKWKDAVLNGDKAALAGFYSASVVTNTPSGKASDPTEEPLFWTFVKAAGLTAFEPKLLERRDPQPGVVVLVLRIYLTLKGTASAGDYIVSESQQWAQSGGSWMIVATQRSDPFPKPALRLPEPAVPNTNLYPDPAQAKHDLDAAIAAAAKDHKNVLVDFGGNWCYDCHVLDEAFHSRELAPLIRANYHVVRVNIAEYDQNLDIAERLQVNLKKGVPELAVLDSKGALLTSTKQGEFESAVKVGPADVTQFLDRWKPAPGK
jgi:thioredoxin family protein